MSARSASTQANKSRIYNPSDMDHYSDIVAGYFESIRTHHRNAIHSGGLAGDPTTGNAQLTGTGNTTWNVDVTALLCCVEGLATELAVAADFSIHSGSFITGFADGESVVAALVLKNDSGTITMDSVQGTPATTGGQVGPTDAEIQAALGAGVSWIKLAETTLNRTADTTVTESHDNTARPLLAVNVDTNMGDF